MIPKRSTSALILCLAFIVCLLVVSAASAEFRAAVAVRNVTPDCYDYITRTSLGEMTGEIFIKEALSLLEGASP